MFYRTESTDERVLRVTNHKAKKSHTCNYCDKEIKKGTDYTKAVFITDGYFGESKQHLDCAKNQEQFAKEQSLKE